LEQKELNAIADKLEEKALKVASEASESVLGAKTFNIHVEFALNSLRLADRLRAMASDKGAPVE
jgi:hypothetical protein